MTALSGPISQFNGAVMSLCLAGANILRASLATELIVKRTTKRRKRVFNMLAAFGGQEFRNITRQRRQCQMR